MVELPRGLAREFRAVLRKCTLGRSREASPFVVCRAGAAGLTLTCESGGVILRHRTGGEFAEGVIAFTAGLLDALEGKRVPVRLAQSAPMKGKALWQEGAEEREMGFEAPEVNEPDFPDVKLHDPGGGFLAALAEAVKTTGKDNGRYALRCVLLRGSEGSLIASNGRQLLVQRGFTLPWKDDALVPALPVLASRELLQARLAEVGRSPGRLVLRCGPWTLALKEQEAGHFPDVARVLAVRDEKPSLLRLDPAEARQLAEALPALPGADEELRPVTLELSRTPSVSGGEQRIPLERSRCQGPALSVRTDRRYLLRALVLGFLELSVAPATPVICRDASRAYAWMPLDTPSGGPAQQRREEPMDGREGNGRQDNGRHEDRGTPEPAQPADPLTEAEALREALNQALARTARLIAALRQQRRQERAVRSAVASLRKLRDLG